MKDETRKPLRKNTKLLIKVNSNTHLEVTVGEVIAYGGSCIAYDGMLILNDNRPVVIKECYPSSIAISRDDNTNELIPENPRDFDRRKELFMNGISRASKFFSEALIKDIFVYGECLETKTVYGVSLKGDGSTLSELVKKENLSINRIAGIMISLCDALAVVHKKHFIYLDTKPENIYCDKNDNVQLFDFDTVIADSEANNRLRMISYSLGWAAPEQLPDNKRRERFRITKKTDIFSVGAVFYWLLCGEKPYSLIEDSKGFVDFSTIEDIEKGSFNYRDRFKICKHVDKIVLKRIESILRGTLTCSPENRVYNTVNELKDAFEFLHQVSFVENRENRTLPAKKQSNNRFNYDSEKVDFCGRNKEMQYLLSMCEDNSDFCWCGICGEAGFGKTRLAYELCKIMEQYEWQVFWPCHAKSSVNQIVRYLNTIHRDTLICFDDARNNVEIITDFVLMCTETFITNSCKIRILLIDRNETDLVNDFSTIEPYKYEKEFAKETSLFIKENGIINLEPIDEKTTDELIVSYLTKQYNYEPTHEEICKILELIHLIYPERLNPQYSILACDLWIKHGSIFDRKKDNIFDYFFDNEINTINSAINEEAHRRSERKKYLEAVKISLVMSTLEDQTLLNDVWDVLETLSYNIDREGLLWVLSKINVFKQGSIYIDGLKPDLFGEYFCLKAFMDLSRDASKTIIQRLLDFRFQPIIQKASSIIGDFEFFDKEMLSIPSGFSPLLYLVNKQEQGYDIYKYYLQYRDHILYKDRKELNSNEWRFYEGEFAFDWMSGRGSLHYNDGKRYYGMMNNDLYNGHGTEQHPNGCYYSGMWINGTAQGKGEKRLENGSKQIGEFLYGDFSAGKLVFPNQTTIEGVWNKGKIVDQAACRFPNGDEYKGHILIHLPIPNGLGTMRYKNGSIRKGLWINGMPIDRIEEYLLPKTTIEKEITSIANLATLKMFINEINTHLSQTNICTLKTFVKLFFNILYDDSGKYEQYQDVESLLVDGFGFIRKD